MIREDDLFTEDFFARLERLRIQARKVHAGNLRAERRSRRTGSSLEFADYRNYSPGDDPRRIDWSIYGRIERLMTKVYEEEDDLDVSILIDCSASMRWRDGEPHSKWRLTQQLAAALAYLGLRGLDRVSLCYFDSAVRAESSIFRGRAAFRDVVQFLRNPPESTGSTNFRESLTSYVREKRRRGLAIVLSDCLDSGSESGLAALTGRHFSLHLVQVADPQECDPTEAGDLFLRDRETNEEISVTATPALLSLYRREFTRFREHLQTWCGGHAAGYSFVRTDASLDDVVLKLFRRGGLLR